MMMIIYIYTCCITLITLDYGYYGMFLSLGDVGCITSTVATTRVQVYLNEEVTRPKCQQEGWGWKDAPAQESASKHWSSRK